MAEHKRITLHPVKDDGTIDTDVNLYPKTFLDGIVNREGEEVEVALKEEIPTNVVSHEELQEGLDTKQDKIVATSADVGKLVGVDSNGNLTLVEAPSGGTKLYKHQISLSGNINSSLIIISNSSTQRLNFDSLDLLVTYRIGGYVDYQGTMRTIIGMYYEQSTIMTERTITYLNVNGTVGTIKFTRNTIISDTVTEL